MDNFQQSELKISLQTWRKDAMKDFRDEMCKSDSYSLQSAMTKDIEPLRISPSKTAAAGEYARCGGVDTRE